MDKADADDSTPPDAGGKAEPNAGSDAGPEPAAPRPVPAYMTATEAITLLAFGKATTLAVLNAEREAFVEAGMEAQAGGAARRMQLREEWAKRDGRGADMAAAVALLLHELRSEKMKVRGTLDGDPEGLVPVVPLEFLLLPVTINNDAFEADPAASMRDFTKARQLPGGGTRPMYRDLLFEAADVLRLCRRKRPKAPRPPADPATLDAWLLNHMQEEERRHGSFPKAPAAIEALRIGKGCNREEARDAWGRRPDYLRTGRGRPRKSARIIRPK